MPGLVSYGPKRALGGDHLYRRLVEKVRAAGLPASTDDNW